MKKIISLALVILMIACTLIGCKKTCEGCDESFFGKGHEVTVLGKKMLICDECYEDAEPWLNLAEDIGDLFSK